MNKAEIAYLAESRRLLETQTFFFVFEEKLTYSKIEGYQTAYSTCATRLFEELVTENNPICGDGG